MLMAIKCYVDWVTDNPIIKYSGLQKIMDSMDFTNGI